MTKLRLAKTSTIVCLLSLLQSVVKTQGDQSVHLRWASSGGGWRAMFADFAYSNVFAQAGLLESSSSKFEAVSSQSGGAWHSLQFFHSPVYYEKATTSTPEEVHEFVTSWMQSYREWSQILLTGLPICSILGDIVPMDGFYEFCDKLDSVGDWAAFTSNMLEYAAAAYGDAGFVDRAVNAGTRVAALVGTEEYIQTSMSPTAQLLQDDSNRISFGPKEDANMVYSLPTCVQYSVTNEGTFYFTNTNASNILDDFAVYSDTISGDFDFNEWDSYPLFEGSQSSGSPLVSKPSDASFMGYSNAPFGGMEATVGQIAAASSAVAAGLSGSVPSVMAQVSSFFQHKMQKDDAPDFALNLFEAGINTLYGLEMIHDLSVCSQWPNDCGETDFRFIDGFYTDDPTLALNIAQFQARNEYDEGTVLKVLMSSNSGQEVAPENVLAYFRSSYNDFGNITPGDYIWPDHDDVFSWPVPVQSPQLFDLHMDAETMDSLTMPLKDIEVTTTIIAATTIDNPVYHVKQGLKVEIFVLRLNTNIPTAILGVDAIDQHTLALAEMAQGIASSQELVDRVKKFTAVS